MSNFQYKVILFLQLAIGLSFYVLYLGIPVYLGYKLMQLLFG